jgi:alkylated DNA repair dioxygenase AlkB
MSWEFLVIEQFFSIDECSEMSAQMWGEFRKNSFRYDQQCTSSPAFTNIFNKQHSDKLKSKIEELAFEKIQEEFTYGRLYFKGEVMVPHKDKYRCKYNCSVTLDFPQGDPWPLYLYSNETQEIQSIKLNRGDLLLFKGSELLHWRNEFKENPWQTQAFWFYNDKKI